MVVHILVQLVVGDKLVGRISIVDGSDRGGAGGGGVGGGIKGGSGGERFSSGQVSVKICGENGGGGGDGRRGYVEIEDEGLPK